MILDSFRKNIIEKAKKYYYHGQFFKLLSFIKDNYFPFFFLSKKNNIKADYLFLYGIGLLYNGHSVKSIPFLLKSIDYSTFNTSEILYHIIKSYILQDDKDNVLTYFKLIVERTGYFYHQLSYFELLKKKYELALPNYQCTDYVEDNPQSLQEKLTQILAFCNINNLDKALSLISGFGDTFYNHYFFNYIYLTLLFRKARYQDIIRYVISHENYCYSFPLLTIYCSALYKAGIYTDARLLLEEFHQFKMLDSLEYFNFLKIDLKNRQYIKCLSTIKKYHSFLIKHPALYHFYKGVTLQKSGLFKEAISEYELIPHQTSYYQYGLFNTALLYFEIDMKNEAKTIFQRISDQFIPQKLYEKWESIFSSYETTSIEKRVSIAIKMLPFILISFSITMAIVFYLYLLYNGGK